MNKKYKPEKPLGGKSWYMTDPGHIIVHFKRCFHFVCFTVKRNQDYSTVLCITYIFSHNFSICPTCSKFGGFFFSLKCANLHKVDFIILFSFDHRVTKISFFINKSTINQSITRKFAKLKAEDFT